MSVGKAEAANQMSQLPNIIIAQAASRLSPSKFNLQSS